MTDTTPSSTFHSHFIFGCPPGLRYQLHEHHLPLYRYAKVTSDYVTFLDYGLPYVNIAIFVELFQVDPPKMSQNRRFLAFT